MLAFGWLDAIPSWAASLLSISVLLFAGAVLARLINNLLTRLTRDGTLLQRSLVARNQRPIRLAIFAAALALGAGVAELTDRQLGMLRHVLVLLLIVLIAWIAHIVLHIWLTLYQRRFSLDASDNLLARKHITQTRILQRVANVLIVMIAVAWALMTFEPVRQYGVSLLASAGAAGLVVGLALQPVLKNIFAGIQLAITQPIRIDDALLIEGEWGKVEEITATYVVLKIWDWRRLILPLSYFIENPFQNWTRETASLIGAVSFFADFTIPVAAIRQEAERIARASPLWDGEVFVVQVVDFRETVMELRILVSAADSGAAFDLRCEMREKLVDFIQAEYPESLPRLRATLDAPSGPDIGVSTSPARAATPGGQNPQATGGT
ncbi:mechanosensitive ion channel family protein [Pseudohoeflea sp. DP4N28-3]|uniref:Mechanosensitive ion channel family protein n=2 Tax=Pseudohoeflea coraliihabitans TaxID=2860393 RepID=A0ABS6WQW3_9HYPH|nr:mechanosensitive ion channel family protein [Pseudohoeflea sp. DP4N28-3]